jgi:hypothetical protein
MKGLFSLQELLGLLQFVEFTLFASEFFAHVGNLFFLLADLQAPTLCTPAKFLGCEDEARNPRAK